MDILNKLQGQIAGVYQNEAMSKHTSLRIGGPADIFIDVSCKNDILVAHSIAKEYSIPIFVFGRGSNILVGDKGIRGIVLHIGNSFSNICIEKNIVYAEAGVHLSKLAYFAADNSLSGLEFASGIPGTVGGAVIMNAGAYGGEMRNAVEYVDFIDESGILKRCNNEQMDFSYRHSALQDNGSIITGVGFKLNSGNKKQTEQTMRELNMKRAEKQPLDYPSCGSVFKRPEGNYAAALIEKCGLKGLSVGACSVSQKHAGFIINNGSATANEYLKLIHIIQDIVLKKTGIKLDTEVRLIGEF